MQRYEVTQASGCKEKGCHCQSFFKRINVLQLYAQVHFSEHDISDLTDKDCGFSVGVGAVYKHPDYKKKALFDNDFAIMLLERRIECSDNVGPVCLPRFAEQLLNEHYVGFRSRVIGWGVTNLVCALSISILSNNYI